jgi:hypothetical protein
VAVVEVFDTGIVAQLGAAQTAAHAPVIAIVHLAVNEQPEALLKSQCIDIGGVHLLGQGGGHTGELEAVQFIESGMVQHVVVLCW